MLDNLLMLLFNAKIEKHTDYFCCKMLKIMIYNSLSTKISELGMRGNAKIITCFRTI